MSFSNNVKQELCGIDINPQTREPFLYGLLYGFKSGEPQLITTNSHICRCIVNSFPAGAVNVDRLSDSKNYSVVISDRTLMEKYSFDVPDIDRSIVSGNDTGTGAFLRGVFLTCGNVSVQKAGYHLELSPGRTEKCRALYNIINEQGMSINISRRSSAEFLYSKNSENISDFLTFIGAMQNSMEIMNIKIYKEFRSNVNRSVNCETANIGKTAAAAAKQIIDIKLIEEKAGLGSLSDELREIARLRLENPDMPLSALGKLLDTPISRSGVNHRLEKIARIAGEYRDQKE